MSPENGGVWSALDMDAADSRMRSVRLNSEA